MWLNTVQRDLRAYNRTLNKAVDLAQNCPLWMLMMLLTPSGACQKRRRIVTYWKLVDVDGIAERHRVRTVDDHLQHVLRLLLPCDSALRRHATMSWLWWRCFPLLRKHITCNTHGVTKKPCNSALSQEEPLNSCPSLCYMLTVPL